MSVQNKEALNNPSVRGEPFGIAQDRHMEPWTEDGARSAWL